MAMPYPKVKIKELGTAAQCQKDNVRNTIYTLHSQPVYVLKMTDLVTDKHLNWNAVAVQ